MEFLYSTSSRLLTAVLTLVVAGSLGNKPVHAGSCHASKSSPHAHGESVPGSSHAHGGPATGSPFVPPHGGQLTKTTWNYYEVVYSPLETRVYVYDMFRAPLPSQGMQGKASMRVRSSGGAFSYPLRFVPASAGQGYLSASVDLRRVRKGDMDVEFQVDNIPNSAEPSVRFTQVYGASGTSESATAQMPGMGMAPAAGQSGMSCHSASGGGSQMAGGHGGNSAQAGCCSDRAGGVAKTASGSHGMFAQAPSGGHNSHQHHSVGGQASRAEDIANGGTSPRVVIARAASTDEAAIRSQKVCPITNQPLGSHGAPTKLLIDGQALFVCCPGCIEKVEKNPDMYLATIAK